MSPEAKADVWVNGVQIPWQAALPINDPTQVIEFETATFKGRCLVRLADLAPNPRVGGRSGSMLAEPYFSGRKRKMQVVVQGRFKRRLRFDQVCKLAMPFSLCILHFVYYTTSLLNFFPRPRILICRVPLYLLRRGITLCVDNFSFLLLLLLSGLWRSRVLKAFEACTSEALH